MSDTPKPDPILDPLKGHSRLLMTIPLKPLQGDRFQPTGFPSLGAATYQTKDGPKLLVESAQSMANRLEMTCWDSAVNKPMAAVDGISHVTVRRGPQKELKDKPFLTDSMLEAHRLNSAYIEQSKGDFFSKTLAEAIGVNKTEPIDRNRFLLALLKYDIGSLIHGVFLESLDGRLRIARALSSFIEASGVQVAASGGAKVDRIQAGKEDGKDASGGFGNVPFSRDEFVADEISLFVNLDLAQIRGYGLPDKAEHLVIVLALFKLRKLIDGDLRLRTACDFKINGGLKVSTHPKSEKPFDLPNLDYFVGKEGGTGELQKAIFACKASMIVTEVEYDGTKKPKAEKPSSEDATESEEDETTDE
jgi:CRISPR-associated protein Csb1